MLNIGKLGRGGEAYYLETVASGAEDYYLHAGEAPGYWLGAAAVDLGLVGVVQPEALRAVLGAMDPESGVALGPSPARKVPGFDLTFRAPKSVSVLWGLSESGVADEVRRAHDAAVLAALRYMENQAGWSRRGAQGRESVRVGGLVAAGFCHRTSRAGDPLLHTHVVVSNLGRAVDDGRWRTLDGRPLYQHAKTAGYLYQAHLRHELTRRLGVEWGPVRNGCADLAGVPASVVREFSRRRGEIEQRLAEHGASSAKAAQTATLETRKAKDYGVAVGALEDDWRQRAAAKNLTCQELAGLLHPASVPALTDAQAERVAAELRSACGLTEHVSTFARRDVVRAWCERLPAGADPAVVESLADGFLAPTAGWAVRLLPSQAGEAGGGLRRSDGRVVRGGDEPRYSTPDLLTLERRALDGAVARRDDAVAVVDETLVAAALARRPSLSAEQQGMVRALTRGGGGVDVVVGKAGSGKTFALDAAREAWQAAGVPVVGCALAARTAAGLQDGTGIASGTLDALLADLDRPGVGGLTPGAVVVVDEAGMVGTRKLARLLSHAERAKAKVVLVGDHCQLPEIEAGGVFRGLTTRLSVVELSENRRQHEPWERDALDELRQGDPTAGIAAYGAHGRVFTATTAEQVRQRLVDDWAHAHDGRTPGDVGVMLAARRIDVDDLNALARRRLEAAGRLTGPTLTAAEREFALGDRVLCSRNDRRLGVFNGDLASVTDVNPDERTLTVKLDRDEQCVELPARYLDAGHLDHAYAMTAHKAQGATVDKAWVLGSDACYREWAYVALSRARAGTRLYLVGAADGTSHGFTAALQTIRAQELAIEHGDPQPAPAPRDPRIKTDVAAHRRRLTQMDYAIAQAQMAHLLAQQRLTDARTRLDQQGSGLRRLTRRDETARLRRNVARLNGDVAAWQQRLDDLTAERTELLETASLSRGRTTIDPDTRSAQRAAAPEAHQRATAEIDPHDDWDIGIA
jgi:conjugative relaxase-like TrwC/TraI family protein